MSEPDSRPDRMDVAVQLHREGRLDEAEAIYRGILLAEPNDSNALHLSGVIAYQRRRFDQAADLIGRAITIAGQVPEYHNNLGNVLLAMSRLAEAEACYRKALRLNPRYVDAHNNLGSVFRNQGKLEEAIASYQRSARIDPSRADIQNNLGMALRDLGRHREAIGRLREAVRLKPDFCDAYLSLADSLKALGKLPEAIDCCSKALAINPAHAKAHFNLGNALSEGGRIEQGIVCYREALRLEPDYCAAHLNLAHALREEGEKEEAASHFGRALLLRPDWLEARWGHCIGHIPLLHDSVEEIATTRDRYRRELEALRSEFDPEAPRSARDAARLVGNCQPFFLAYQGENDRELQSSYGTLMARIQSALFPSWAKSRPMPPHRQGEPLRVGIVSGFFYRHSNWKIPIKGWAENLNRKEFHLFGYYTGQKRDEQTDGARSSFCQFAEDVGSMEAWCELICKDRLHVLIFPEIGMDPMTVRLASLRLAPIQCSSWGHPETSGLPTVDYFLSSDLMEPADAESHYSERLVRLPNLSIYYTPPPIEVPPLDRARFGLRDDTVVYLCAQSLFKYLPQFDDVFPRIAREVPGCQFAFLSYVKSPHLGERFKRRLDSAFSRYGLRSDEFVTLLPHLDPSQYQALNRLADVFLDSLGWSGCNTTLEALSHDLPVITMPGRLMRGRHSYAILSMLGLHETIANDLDQYVSLAIRLGVDGGLRRRISEAVESRKYRAYQDTACIQGLEAFLKHAVSGFPPR